MVMMSLLHFFQDNGGKREEKKRDMSMWALLNLQQVIHLITTNKGKEESGTVVNKCEFVVRLVNSCTYSSAPISSQWYVEFKRFNKHDSAFKLN